MTLHPAALSRPTEMLPIVAKHLPTIDASEDREAYEAARSLIKTEVIVDRDDGGIDCEITGTITPLVAWVMGDGNGSGGGT